LSQDLTIGRDAGRTAGRTAGRPAVRAASTGRGFHIASLDGIRALAAMIVFLGHAGLQQFVAGGFGVTVFFFLSGFLITTLLRREYERSGGISLKAFYLRRVYRIFPPLYLVLVVLLVLSLAGVFRTDMHAGAVAAQFAHLTNYAVIALGEGDKAPVVPYTIPMWSLAVEEHFYLLFPLGLLLLLRRRSHAGVALALAAGCAAVLCWRIFLFFTLPEASHYIYHASDTRLDSLLFGCIMGMWLNPALDPAPKGIGERTWLAICVLALTLLVSTFLYREEWFRDTLRFTLQGIALFPLFYCAVRFSHWPLFSWLNSWPARMLGLISYTFYLSHAAALGIAKQHLDGGLARAVTGFGIAVAFSWASYVLMERRFAALRHRLH
jgi:peptidoglycan/LPS O-acetylase OafA/YrhL